MTVRVRKLPMYVTTILIACVVFLFAVFVFGPEYNLATNRATTGRVVQADTSGAKVLVGNQFYDISNDCINLMRNGADSCQLKEGNTAAVLVSSTDKKGLQLSYILASLLIGIGGSLVIASICLDIKFKKPRKSQHSHHANHHTEPHSTHHT